MKKTFAVLSILLLMGCADDTLTVDPYAVTNKITYMKDTASGLCFATLISFTYGYRPVTSIACVPCDSINKLLKK